MYTRAHAHARNSYIIYIILYKEPRAAKSVFLSIFKYQKPKSRENRRNMAKFPANITDSYTRGKSNGAPLRHATLLGDFYLAPLSRRDWLFVVMPPFFREFSRFRLRFRRARWTAEGGGFVFSGIIIARWRRYVNSFSKNFYNYFSAAKRREQKPYI